jgi:hypothetical protein
MTVYDTYGTSTYSVSELAQLLADHLGPSFVERDSAYRGVYLIADAANYHVEIQPNAIPAEDGLYDEHPGIQTLLLLTGPDRDSALTAALSSVDTLVLLTEETT